MKNRTTLQVPKELLNEIKELKQYKRETYGDVLYRLIRKKHSKDVINLKKEAKL